MPKPEPKSIPGYGVPQYAVADLAVMRPDEIVEHKIAGALDRMLGVEPTPGLAPDLIDGTGQLSAVDAEVMTTEQIVAAHAAGRFDAVLGKPTTHPI